MSEYARAMQKEQERLEKARKRNAEEALNNNAGDDDDGDALEAAWDGVFQQNQQAAADGADDARRRKAQKKSEKQREKRAAEAANAGQCTAYVTGIPKEVGFTAVQNLFAKVGAVRRVKLYKDERGEQKGDGIVTFAKEEGLAAALAKDDWQIFGDALTVTRAAFAERPEATAKNDWSRIAVIKGIFATEEIGASGDAKAYISNLEDEVWRECLRFGAVERVAVFAADLACPAAVRFADAAAAAACISAMDGRWYNERSLVAEEYDGARKRALAADADAERQARIKPPTPPPPEPPPAAAAPPPAEPSAADAVLAAAAAEAAAAPPPPLRLPDDTYVKIRGLVGAAQHNGSVGVIKGVDGATGRYQVSLSDGKQLALRPTNLLQMLSVTLAGLDGDDAAHNGAAATIFDYDDEANMYGVELGSGDALAVAAASVVLPDRAVAWVHGLQSAPELNGGLAQVLEHDAAAGRYVVRVDGGKQMRLRRQALKA